LSFWGEMKRRNVFRVGTAYLVASWLVVQVITVLDGPLSLPQNVDTVLIVLLAIGFPIALLIAWAYEITSDGLKRTSAVEPSESITHITGQRLNYVVTILLALAVVVLVIDNYVLTDDSPVQAAAATNEQNPNSGTEVIANSIAVLPFLNLSSDPDQGFFADGLSEQLLNELTRIEDLQVAGRTSSFYFKDRNEDMRAIGEALGVANLLEGSVQRSDDQIRITAQLINASSGYHLWSETYNRQFDDIFAIQDEIAMAVASALEVTLGLSEFGRIPGMTRNVAAYDEFLLGTNGGGSSAAAYRASISHLEAAVARDPDFAMAWMRLYRRYADGVFAYPEIFPDGADRSQLALERARNVAPDSYFVLQGLHLEAAQQSDWLQADRYIDQAYAAAATYSLESQVEFDRIQFQLATGRAADALEGLKNLSIIEPLDAQVSLFLAESYSIAGDYDAALAEFDRGLTLDIADPAYFLGGAVWAALAAGDETEITTRLAAGGDTTRAAQAYFADPQAAVESLRQQSAEPGRSGFEQHLIADWAAYFGDQDLALEAKTKAFATGSAIGIAFTLWRPIYRDMRRTEGFKTLVSNIGLVDYWRATGNWGDFCRPVGNDDFECI
jgi:TolB-like protein